MAEKSAMKLHPFRECAENAKEMMAKGATVHQQFNCASCGAKQTMDVPNVFYTSGRCEECSRITNIEKDGCNFLVHFNLRSKL
jgi:hypothetical protein